MATLRRSPARREHNRGAPTELRRNTTSGDNRDVRIATEFRKESEGRILAGPGGGWGVGHATSGRFTGSRTVHSLHRYVEEKGRLVPRLETFEALRL